VELGGKHCIQGHHGYQDVESKDLEKKMVRNEPHVLLCSICPFVSGKWRKKTNRAARERKHCFQQSHGTKKIK
jgi:hypothetical protein